MKLIAKSDVKCTNKNCLYYNQDENNNCAYYYFTQSCSKYETDWSDGNEK